MEQHRARVAVERPSATPIVGHESSLSKADPEHHAAGQQPDTSLPNQKQLLAKLREALSVLRTNADAGPPLPRHLMQQEDCSRSEMEALPKRRRTVTRSGRSSMRPPSWNSWMSDQDNMNSSPPEAESPHRSSEAAAALYRSSTTSGRPVCESWSHLHEPQLWKQYEGARMIERQESFAAAMHQMAVAEALGQGRSGGRLASFCLESKGVDVCCDRLPSLPSCCLESKAHSSDLDESSQLQLLRGDEDVPVATHNRFRSACSRRKQGAPQRSHHL